MGHNSASDHPTQSNSIHIQSACIQGPNWEYLHLRSLCYGQGYIGRPPGTSKSPEFGQAGTGPSSAITNVYCSRSERMLCGILEQTNTPQPRQGINTGSSSADGGVEDSWKHTCHATSTFTAIQTCVTFRISEVVDFISSNHETDFWSSSKIWLLVSEESCMGSSWSFSSWTCFRLIEHLGQVG